MTEATEQEKALRLATEAGHILLENGAEISRVEQTMEHIASAYGVSDESFFVLRPSQSSHLYVVFPSSNNLDKVLNM